MNSFIYQINRRQEALAKTLTLVPVKASPSSANGDVVLRGPKGWSLTMAADGGVARELGVDYGRLKKRFERGMALPPAMADKNEVQFVEMFAAPAPAPAVAPQAGCIVEMENARGAKMRIELKSFDGLAGLTSAFDVVPNPDVTPRTLVMQVCSGRWDISRQSPLMDFPRFGFASL